MIERYHSYFEAIQKLLTEIGDPKRDDYLTVLTLQGRLAHLSKSEELYGETQSTQANFAQILETLNQISLQYANKSFNDLTGLGTVKPQLTAVKGKRQFMFGVVINVNVVNFSKLADSQSEINRFLETEVQNFLAIIGVNHWLNFQGGYFVLFIERLSDETKLESLIKGLCFGLRLQLKAAEYPFRLGITIHWESDAEYHYIDDSVYLIGPGINDAQLFMSFSNGGHFFLSTQVYDAVAHLFSHENEPRIETLLTRLRTTNKEIYEKVFSDTQMDTYVSDAAYYCEEFTFHDKYKQLHKIFNFYIQNQEKEIVIGNQDIPNHRVAIEYRDPRVIRPQQVFIKRLVEADEVTIMGITNEGTAKFLEEALQERNNRFWNKLQVVFPSENILPKIIEQNKSDFDRRRHWESGKQSVFRFLLSQGKDCLNNWECLEYDGNFPFIGNWFSSTDSESVRIAPVLPGGDAREVYYTEFFKGTKAYEQVRDAFSVICNSSNRIIEWNLYGKYRDNDFLYYGIVNRKRLNDFPRKHIYDFPVVLVMLHGEVQGLHLSILQQRTIFNASSDFGKYSNISGRLTNIDVYMCGTGFPDIIEYDDEDDDIATNMFNDQVSLEKGAVLLPKAWEMAAVREVKEELGLSIKPERLIYQATYPLKRSSGSLLFNIFSLELIRNAKVDEFQLIKNSRPYANLSPFSMKDLNELFGQNQLNALLQNRFEEVFVQIFKKLKIEEEC